MESNDKSAEELMSEKNEIMQESWMGWIDVPVAAERERERETGG